MPLIECGKTTVDYSEAGSGDTVVLVHSSVSGNRQWRRLAQDLQPHYRVLALNLFGYGATSAWSGPARQTIDDQARLVSHLVQGLAGPVRLVGHSFGGSVACQAARMLGSRVSHLCLFEPTLFHLLAQNGCEQAFSEAMALRDHVRQYGQRGDWAAVAERFVKYWLDDDAWTAMPPERRLAYMELLRPNFHEWDSVDSQQSDLYTFLNMPMQACMLYSPDARRSSREIARLFAEHCPNWSVVQIAAGGHMAPLTHPEVVNPLIAQFLQTPHPVHERDAADCCLPGILGE